MSTRSGTLFSWWLATALLLLAAGSPAAGMVWSRTAPLTMPVGSQRPLAAQPASPPVASEAPPPVTMAVTALAPAAQPCTGTFIAHDLDHVTTVPGDTVDQFEANGAGVAIGDLDNDGDLDVVLANHAGPNTILWNQGALNFRSEQMPIGDSRAVNLVDVDGDGWLDIVLTRRTGAINYWHNEEPGPAAMAGLPSEPAAVAGLPTVPQRQFVQRTLPGIARPAYAMNWADLDRDGDLDLVTGSYDASLLVDQGNDFLLGSGAGVFVYENRSGRFVGQRLASTAQAMSIVFFDANADGWPDIVVGNDFALPDYLWLRSVPQSEAGDVPGQHAGWQRSAFDTTSYSTMSLDTGDVDNDGVPELFSTDMMPYSEEPSMVAAYEPLMADMDEDNHPEDDPQVMANVLQMRTDVIGYQDVARPRGVDASGWSWSAKFGDLDLDGWLDLYVVNGMAEATLFAHLPGGELVEENQALHNSGDGYFRSAPAWGLGSTYGGRGMSMGDLDGDGDLDIVVNNLRGPAQLFENRLRSAAGGEEAGRGPCSGASLQVDLRWPDSANTRAIGAVGRLHTSAGTFTRDVRVASGYLSADPARLHFGFPVGTELQSLEIRWPDGAVSQVAELRPQTLLVVTRTAEAAPAVGENQRSTAASPAEEAATAELDARLQAIIADQGLTGDPSTGRDLPSIEDPLAQLGMKLFFSKALGGDLDTACVSCHHPLLAGGDGLALSIGVGADEPDLLGPGRSHAEGPTVPRNAPSTFNVAFYDQVLFHDGRIESLGKTPGRNGAGDLGIRTPDSLFGEADPQAGADLVAAQSRFPLTSREEMRGFQFEAHRPGRYVRSHLCGRLGDFGGGRGELVTTGWPAEFQAALGNQDDAQTLITDGAVAEALSAYQRSQVFVDTPWRAYVQGDDDAISLAARRGALLFFQPIAAGGAGCSGCHSGDFFTDERFHALAVPQVGPGKGDGPFNDDDYGRFRESGRPEDLYAFRTPTLLNVAVTGPYGHDGAYTTLEGIVRHHLDPAAAVAAYDPAQLDPAVQTEHMAFNTARALATLEARRRAGRSLWEPLRLSDGQVADLLSFLRALTDPCVLDAVCLAPWIPGDTDSDPDGLRLRARIAAPVAR